MRSGLAVWVAVALTVMSPELRAEGEGPERDLHAQVAGGIYGSLFAPTDWGPSLKVNVLPGGSLGRYGVRAEWRGDEGFEEGLGLLGLVFEAGTARPQLALNLITNLGMTFDGAPMVGGGVEGSLWLFGPLGITALSDAHLVIDGSDSSLALTTSLSLHLGF